MLDALESDLLGPRSASWARVALALAFALAAYAVFRLLLSVALGPSLPAPAPVTVTAPEVSAASAQSVAAWHLFGNATGPIDLAALAQSAPETALQLTLKGTLNENAPEGGIAIIADEQGVDQAYRVGDTLPGGARLEGIYTARVLLSRGGVNESLSLPRGTTGTTPNAAPRPATSNDRGPVPGLKLPGTSAAPAPFVQPLMAPGAPSLDSYRDAVVPDAAELAKQVQIYPVIENGRMAGVRLAAGRDSDLLSRSGIRPTDLVTAVNGIPLDGPQRSTELINALKDARSVQVTVRRDGQETQLSIGLR